MLQPGIREELIHTGIVYMVSRQGQKSDLQPALR